MCDATQPEATGNDLGASASALGAEGSDKSKEEEQLFRQVASGDGTINVPDTLTGFYIDGRGQTAVHIAYARKDYELVLALLAAMFHGVRGRHIERLSPYADEVGTTLAHCFAGSFPADMFWFGELYLNANE